MIDRIGKFVAAIGVAIGLSVCSGDVASAVEHASNESGIDQTIISPTIRPGEDFFRYANQKWLDETKIPADRSDYGIFTILDDRTQEQVRDLIDEVAAKTDAPARSAARKVGDLHRSYLDIPRRNAAGLEPLAESLRQIAEADSLSSLASAMGRMHRIGVASPLAAYVSVDARDSDAYTVYVTQSGLTLPDRDYYLSDEPRYIDLREQLKQYAADLLNAAAIENAADLAAQIVEIETKLAEIQWTKTDNRDPEKTYNRRSSEQASTMMGALDWDAWATAYGIPQGESVVVRQPSYFESLGATLERFSLEDWKAYQMFHLLDAYASSLSEGLEERHFEFHGRGVSGIDEQRPLWKRAVASTGSVLGELVGQLYVEKHFTPEAKKRMEQLVGYLKTAFADRIKGLDWMGEGTQKQALEKLSLFNTKIGYPDVWKSYDKLEIRDAVLAENLMAASEFETQRDLDRLGGPIDRNEWHMTPQTINAYYNATMNEIVFPAAILQPPFFNLEAEDAVNFGAIGAVIGHELSHGFDDKGSKFDGRGNLRKWWTEEDRAEFERRAAGLVAQYNEYRPVEDMSINGELTLGENIGDLGGLTVAHAAYRLSLEGREPPVIDGLTGDQRFFLGWGQIWRRLYRDQELRKRLIVDPHSPSQYRVNGIVRNMDAFYDAFEIKPSDPLYLAPDDRIRIW